MKAAQFVHGFRLGCTLVALCLCGPLLYGQSYVPVEWSALNGFSFDPIDHVLSKTAPKAWNNCSARSLNRLNANKNGTTEA